MDKILLAWKFRLFLLKPMIDSQVSLQTQQKQMPVLGNATPDLGEKPKGGRYAF